DFAALGVYTVLFEDGLGAGRSAEHAGHDSLVSTVTNDVRGCLSPHQKRQSIDQNGLAGAGFAGEQIEPGAENGDSVIDDGVVLGSEFDEHSFYVSTAHCCTGKQQDSE